MRPGTCRACRASDNAGQLPRRVDYRVASSQGASNRGLRPRSRQRRVGVGPGIEEDPPVDEHGPAEPKSSGLPSPGGEQSDPAPPRRAACPPNRLADAPENSTSLLS